MGCLWIFSLNNFLQHIILFTFLYTFLQNIVCLNNRNNKKKLLQKLGLLQTVLFLGCLYAVVENCLTGVFI